MSELELERSERMKTIWADPGYRALQKAAQERRFADAACRVPRGCVWCGKEFFSPDLRQRFCSRSCVSRATHTGRHHTEQSKKLLGEKASERRHRRFDRECGSCGVTFKGDEKQLYCGSKCRQRAKWQRILADPKQRADERARRARLRGTAGTPRRPVLLKAAELAIAELEKRQALWERKVQQGERRLIRWCKICERYPAVNGSLECEACRTERLAPHAAPLCEKHGIRKKIQKQNHLRVWMCGRCKREGRRARYDVELGTSPRTKKIWLRDGGRCAYCGVLTVLGESPKNPNGACRDHIVPLSAGGPTESSNLVLACHRCNALKHTRGPEWIAERLGWGE